MATVGNVTGPKKIIFGGGTGFHGLDTLTDTWIITNPKTPQNDSKHLYDNSNFVDISLSAGPFPPKAKSGAMAGYKDITVLFGGVAQGKEFLGSRLLKDVWIFEQRSKGMYTWSTLYHELEELYRVNLRLPKI